MKTQQLSTTMRAIYATGNEIGYTLFGLMPPKLTAPKPIPAGLSDIPKIVTDMIPEFQELRQHGQTGPRLGGRDLWRNFDMHPLPIVHGFAFGSAARTVREAFERMPTYRIGRTAHFVVAAIAGGVVGRKTMGQAASVPPLALAFLIGFSVDVFLSFRETLSQSFIKRSDPEPRSKPAPAGT